MARVRAWESREEGEGQGLGWAPGLGVIPTGSCCVVPKGSPSTRQEPCAASSGIRPGPISRMLSSLLSILPHRQAPVLGCVPDPPGLGRTPGAAAPARARGARLERILPAAASWIVHPHVDADGEALGGREWRWSRWRCWVCWAMAWQVQEDRAWLGGPNPLCPPHRTLPGCSQAPVGHSFPGELVSALRLAGPDGDLALKQCRGFLCTLSPT